MSGDIFGELGQVGPIVLGSVGIWVALLNQRRQLNVQMFVEFSGRFQKILREFPTEAWLANRNPSQPLPPPSRELTDCTLYCMQFIADAYYLHQNGYISKKIWKIWEREIRRTLTGPLFLREWQNVSLEFSHVPQFLKYIDSIMSDKHPQRSTH